MKIVGPTYRLSQLLPDLAQGTFKPTLVQAPDSLRHNEIGDRVDSELGQFPNKVRLPHVMKGVWWGVLNGSLKDVRSCLVSQQSADIVRFGGLYWR